MKGRWIAVAYQLWIWAVVAAFVYYRLVSSATGQRLLARWH